VSLFVAHENELAATSELNPSKEDLHFFAAVDLPLRISW
jgi:hypothetical protein